MSTPMHDEKPIEDSVQEKDAQVGTSEEVLIDPIAEKKVGLVLYVAGMTPC